VSVDAEAHTGEAKSPRSDKVFLNPTINQAAPLSLPTFSTASVTSRHADGAAATVKVTL
jgi:hypothetical protein